MPKKKESPSKKFNTPLYGAAWGAGDFVYLAGGGGGGRSGIKNRIVVAKHKDGQLSEELAEYNTGTDAPMRLLLHPNKRSLLIGWGKDGLGIVDIDSSDRIPQLSPLEGDGRLAERLRSFPEVSCMRFTGDGRYLAVGGPEGYLVVAEWPTLDIKVDLRTAENALHSDIRDLDFSMAHHDKLLATTDDKGSCVLWKWEDKLAVAWLDLPTELQRFSFARCRFSRDGSPGLYTVAKTQKEAVILHWEQDVNGEHQLMRRFKLKDDVVTAFEISPDGQYLGIGTSEGTAFVLSVDRLSAVQQRKGAHMVFATAIAFSGDSNAVVTVSADASAHPLLVHTPKPGGVLTSPSALVLYAAVLLALILALLQMLPKQLHPSFLDELLPAWIRDRVQSSLGIRL